jgi:UDP-GlcNAc:undecaprenyl-phosphate GlcNAc-1-phosphate transferase
MSPIHVLWAGVACVVSVAFTMIVRSFGIRHAIVDRAERDPQPSQARAPVPLLGGVAIWCAFACTILLVLLISPDRLLGGYLLEKHLIGILLGGLLLMVGGVRDDLRSRTPAKQILWPLLASLCVIASGIGITYLSNPFGSTFRFDQLSITLFSYNDLPYRFVVFADLFAIVWLLVSMYTTKFLDGVDGLVSGISVIGMVILFFLSMSKTVGQPETALVALIGAGAFLGFLFFNFAPAKIFLGEGGSLWAGFLLGTLAILSGGKIATALLILGIPMLDVIWVILRRLFSRVSIFHGDKKHLHFRLLDIGLSTRQAVLLLYCCSAVFGSATLFTEGKTKFFMLIAVVALMLLLGVMLLFRSKRRQSVHIDSNHTPPYTGVAVE